MEDTSWNVAAVETTGNVERHEIRDILGINEYSCGRSSPHFSDEYGAYIVISNGYVDLYSWSASYSYGKD